MRTSKIFGIMTCYTKHFVGLQNCSACSNMKSSLSSRPDGKSDKSGLYGLGLPSMTNTMVNKEHKVSVKNHSKLPICPPVYQRSCLASSVYILKLKSRGTESKGKMYALFVQAVVLLYPVNVLFLSLIQLMNSSV